MVDMPGITSADATEPLKDAPDQECQTTWLEMMKKHREGAIEMATTEQQVGKFDDASSPPDSIVSAQWPRSRRSTSCSQPDRATIRAASTTAQRTRSYWLAVARACDRADSVRCQAGTTARLRCTSQRTAG